MNEASRNERQMVLFDGLCGFCDGMVQMLVRLDRRRVFRYAPLQGPTATALREEGLAVPADLSTFVLVCGQGADARVYTRSAAVIRVAHLLGWPWRLAWVGWLVPWPLRDVLYGAFAAARYRLFGRLDACRLPRPDERVLFLP